MQTIRLLNAQSEFVHGAQIPNFSELPKVIVWGTRSFVFSATTNKGKNTESVAEYVEAFSFNLK